MTRERPSPADRRRAWLALAVLAIAAWLDRDGCVVANQSAVFGFVISALVAAGEAIGSAAGYIAVHLEAVVAWLLTTVKWLTGHVADILQSTGAMFARVWDGLKAYYNAVLKPFALEVYGLFTRVRDWLTKIFTPILDWLQRARKYLLELWNDWVKPVLDIVDIVRGGLRVLGDLGVEWAKELDQRLAEYESLVTENFLKILAPLNKAIDVVNSIVTGDLLLQRIPFLSTLYRDITYVRAAVLQAMLDLRAHPPPAQLTVVDDAKKKADAYSASAVAFARDGSGPYAEIGARLTQLRKEIAGAGAGAFS